MNDPIRGREGVVNLSRKSEDLPMRGFWSFAIQKDLVVFLQIRFFVDLQIVTGLTQ